MDVSYECFAGQEPIAAGLNYTNRRDAGNATDSVMSWIFLSHVVDETTPLYGERGQIRIDRFRSTASGDASNSSDLALPAHCGTHVDAPRHFSAEGVTLESFPPGFWRAEHPWLLTCPCNPGEILGLERLGESLLEVPAECDSLLLRTGFERHRTENPAIYAKQGPGLAPDLAYWLRQNRSLRFLGMDFVSASSFLHRAVGHQAHKAFLSADAQGSSPILLVEDMALSSLSQSPKEMWLLPLRYANADGAPVTIVALT